MLTIAEARAAAAKINAAVERRERDRLLAAYQAYRGEARACGYEVETFNEYVSERSAKDEAMDMMIEEGRICNHAYLDR